MSHSIAITTCQTYPNLPENLQPLVRLLQANGLQVKVDCWQNQPQADVILPLCAWDYAQQPERFRQWLQQAVEFGQKFANPVRLMDWNMHKSYLLDLQQMAVDVIPSQLLLADLDQIQTACQPYHPNGQAVVIKPAIGQSGNAVIKWQADQPIPDFSPYLGQQIVLQPYIAEVAENGETSLIFFAGEFSHAVRRQPPKGEWRANSAYGVTILPTIPPQNIVRQARDVLMRLPEMPSYARVDGTIIGDRFLLNELELIEPALYLHTDPQAAARFAQVLMKKITGI